jgi:DNA-binding CsgD family transcriptional regulator/PAS domain-containing protein
MGGPHNYLTEITLTLVGVLMALEAVPLLRIERKGAMHYVAAAFSVLIGAFMAIFGFSLVAPSIRTEEVLSRVTELLSIVVMPLFLHGIVLLTSKGAVGRRGFWQVLIYLPAIALLAVSARGSFLFEGFFVDERGVWNAVNKTEGWPVFLYWIYAIGCFLVGLCFLFSWRFRSRNQAEKRLGRSLNRATALVLAIFCLNMVGNFGYLYRNSPWWDFGINLIVALGFYIWIIVFRRVIVAMTGGVADAASAGGAAGRARPERIRQALVAMFAQPAFLLDREGRIEYCNHAAAALFGAQEGELRGRALGELLDEPGAVAAVLAGQLPASQLRARSAATGRDLTLSFRSVLGEAGIVAGYICQCAAADARPASSSVPGEAGLPSEGIKLPYGEEISSREYEVLFLLAEGLDVDGIAERLFIAPSTVKSHIHHLYQKTGARNRVELIKLVGAS